MKTPLDHRILKSQEKGLPFLVSLVFHQYNQYRTGTCDARSPPLVQQLLFIWHFQYTSKHTQVLEQVDQGNCFHELKTLYVSSLHIPFYQTGNTCCVIFISMHCLGEGGLSITDISRISIHNTSFSSNSITVAILQSRFLEKYHQHQ